MSSVVVRRMVLATGGLLALVLAVGVAAVVSLGWPAWIPAVLAIVFLGGQYLLGPVLVRWLIPAQEIPHDGHRYLTDEPIGELVARRCRAAGLPLVRLGIVDDGAPNAFAFGHTPRSGHVWLTRGLLERLDDDEVDAVVCHELAHVRNWDMVVTTTVALVPMVLYLVYVVTRSIRGPASQAVASGALAAYLASKLLVLSVSRTREIAADRWSVRCRGDSAAMSSALVKVAYGIGEVDAARAATAAALIEDDREPTEDEERLLHRARRMGAARIMGIASEADGKALAGLLDRPDDVARARSALTWDRASPWSWVLEKLSTHPLVATRLDLLSDDGAPASDAPAAPSQDLDSASTGRTPVPVTVAGEALIAVAPWFLAWGCLVSLLTDRPVWLATCLLGFGVSYTAKQALRYGGHRTQVSNVADLLHRLDAGPVQGIPVEVRGRVEGRGLPGYVLSPDLVVEDDSGFLTLVYTNPLPFAREWFGGASAGAILGHEVVARGWYFRGPGPWVELRDVRVLDAAPGGPDHVRAWQWMIAPIVGAFALVAGVVLLTASIA